MSRKGDLYEWSSFKRNALGALACFSFLAVTGLSVLVFIGMLGTSSGTVLGLSLGSGFGLLFFGMVVENSVFANVVRQIKEAAFRMGLDERILEKMVNPEISRKYVWDIPVKVAGEEKKLIGFRIVIMRRGAKGGIRFDDRGL